MEELCPRCLSKGKKKNIKVYQINLNEAVRFCEDEKCSYALEDPSAIVDRNFTEIERKEKTSRKKRAESFNQTVKNSNKNSAAWSSLTSAERRNVPLKEKIGVFSLQSLQNSKPKQSFSTWNQVKISNTTKSPISQNIRHTTEINKNRKYQAMDIRLTKNPDTHTAKPLVTSNENGELLSNTRHAEVQSSTMDSTYSLASFSISSESNDTNDIYPKHLSSINKQSQMTVIEKSELGLLYPQWQNKDALCWLDVLMCLLVHSQHLQSLVKSDSLPCGSNSLLSILLKAYNQAIDVINQSKNNAQKPVDKRHTSIMQPILNTCLNTEDLSQQVGGISLNTENVKTGAGFQNIQTDLLSVLKEHASADCFTPMYEMLSNVREKIWQNLEPCLRCKKGVNDSPLTAIPAFLKLNKGLEKYMSIKYSWSMWCNHCQHTWSEYHEKVLPTFVNTSENFNLQRPSCYQACSNCGALNQRVTMLYKKLPPIFLLHFQEGLKNLGVQDLDFYHDDDLYRVSGVIQYTTHPDHFVTWVRHQERDIWMECNDLKSPICYHNNRPFSIPPEEVHIVMWEQHLFQKSKQLSCLKEKKPQNVQSKPTCRHMYPFSDTKNIIDVHLSSKTIPQLPKDDISEVPLEVAPMPNADVSSFRDLFPRNQNAIQSNTPVKMHFVGNVIPAPHDNALSKNSPSTFGSFLPISRAEHMMKQQPTVKAQKLPDNLIIAKILAARNQSGEKSSAGILPRKKVFQGYVPKSQIKLSAGSNTVETEFCMPPSPALSSCSDSVISVKRKKMTSTKSALKRQKSEAWLGRNVPENISSQPNLCQSTKISVPLVSDNSMNYNQNDDKEILKSLSNNPSTDILACLSDYGSAQETVNTDLAKPSSHSQSAQEQEILKSLYNELDMDMPDDFAHPDHSTESLCDIDLLNEIVDFLGSTPDCDTSQE